MAKKFIQGAINPEHKGDFAAAAKRAGMSTREYAIKHEHDRGADGKLTRLAHQALLALTLMGLSHKRNRKTIAGQ